MSIPTPINPYFLIKISKEKQLKNGQMVGSIFLPNVETMENNVQCGEIVSKSERAHKYFPEANVGDILLIHHFVENSNLEEAKEEHWAYEDAEYNYYLVTPKSHAGKGNEIYGVWNGEKIITHPDYVLLEYQAPIVYEYAPDANFDIDSHLEVSDGGILLIADYTETREELTARTQSIKEYVQNLGDKNKLNHQIQVEVARKEEEMQIISNKINEVVCLPYNLLAFNEKLSEDFRVQLNVGDTLYCKSNAVLTTITFLGKEYRTCKTLFVEALANAV